MEFIENGSSSTLEIECLLVLPEKLQFIKQVNEWYDQECVDDEGEKQQSEYEWHVFYDFIKMAIFGSSMTPAIKAEPSA